MSKHTAHPTHYSFQLCTLCGGKLEETIVIHEERRGTTYLYLFENVPAIRCGECRDIWIDDEVLEQIDRLIETGVPVRKVETPVYDFSRAVAPAH